MMQKKSENTVLGDIKESPSNDILPQSQGKEFTKKKNQRYEFQLFIEKKRCFKKHVQ